MTKRIPRATGTRTAIDVMKRFARLSLADGSASDLDAVENGESRLVRCYLKPDSDEKREHWKPGYLEVSKGKLIWRGSSTKWQPVELLASEWRPRLRNVRPEEHVYRSWTVIECACGSDVKCLAVPKLDAQLCLSALWKSS